MFEIKSIFYGLIRMLHLSEFVWTLRSSVFVVFNNFLLIDATDKSKISSDQKRFFIALSLYPLSFFANTPFKALKFQTYIFWSNRICSLKYLRSTTLGWKYIGITKLEFAIISLRFFWYYRKVKNDMNHDTNSLRFVNIKVWMFGSLVIFCVFGSTAWIVMIWLLNNLIVIKIIGWKTGLPDYWIF